MICMYFAPMHLCRPSMRVPQPVCPGKTWQACRYVLFTRLPSAGQTRHCMVCTVHGVYSAWCVHCMWSHVCELRMQIQRRVGVPGSPDQPPALPLNTTSTHTNTAASDLSLPAPITGGYLQSWLDVSPLDVEAGRMAHPLRGWSAALNTSDLVAHQDTKAMLVRGAYV